MNITKIMCALFTLTALTANGDIYKSVDAKGNTIYSNIAPGKNKPDNENYNNHFTDAEAVKPPTNYRQQENNSPSAILIQQDAAALSDCQSTKRSALSAEKYNAHQAEKLNEWLWKNCRPYASELRAIEQSAM